jgi:branched-chain amino acid transport system ATP-binding protein
MPHEPLLRVTDLTKRFGHLVAVNKVSLQVRSGEIVGLIGPNGAGKTTLFNSIAGLYRADGGRVEFKGQDTTGMLAHAICKLGLSRTFQVVKVFDGLTVEEAVRVGAYNRCGEKEVPAVVDDALQICSLTEFRHQRCGDLGLAVLRRVELARAVATKPDLLLLDEAGAGLTATEIAGLMNTLNKLNSERGITLCIVEHVMQLVMGCCQRIIVLDAGEVIGEGCPSEISEDSRVIEAYLGKRAVL